MGGADDAKRRAAEHAASLVHDGMVLGLGTGSTANLMLAALAARVRDGLKVRGVPTSETTMQLARHLGVPLTTLDDDPQLDLTLDGADEVDPQFRLIKGLGGALLREKVVAAASRRVCIMVDEGKLVAKLGTKAPVPVEVARFAWQPVQARLRAIGAEPALRRTPDGAAFVSDNGNVILDARFARGIDQPEELERALNNIPGVMENGLFLGLATEVVVGSAAGARMLRRA
ncbi:MAG TPA: ribose-5-phosphate isomerase RpiA [Candidatus Thermoplasmatota archaeon]|jgi:ribose 5-phosphate isomerase A|nr:ribose-5-phosphate isomerase RpiA [Candidatus Thermoplasmatota archaeon]